MNTTRSASRTRVQIASHLLTALAVALATVIVAGATDIGRTALALVTVVLAWALAQAWTWAPLLGGRR